MKIKQEHISQIERLAAEGVLACDVASRFKTHVGTVKRVAKQYGIVFKRKPAPSTVALGDRDKRLCDAFQEGRSLQAVGAMFGVSRERVRQILNKYGITERWLWKTDTQEIYDAAIDLYIKGDDMADIARAFELSRRQLSALFAERGGLRPFQRKRRIARFWRNVNITESVTECWEWQACREVSGYGHLNWEHRQTSAHRVAFELHYGQRPSNWVLHRCDNPPCVNPHHLYDGTPQENVSDREQRGRSAFHKGVGGRKLTADDVAEIRELLSGGCMTQFAIAERFNVGIAAINNINTGRTWSGQSVDCKSTAKKNLL